MEILTLRSIGIRSYLRTAAPATLARRFGGLELEVEGEWPVEAETAEASASC